MEVNGKSVMVAFGAMITTLKPDKLERVKGASKGNIGGAKGGVKTDLSKRKLNFKAEIYQMLSHS